MFFSVEETFPFYPTTNTTHFLRVYDVVPNVMDVVWTLNRRCAYRDLPPPPLYNEHLLIDAYTFRKLTPLFKRTLNTPLPLPGVYNSSINFGSKAINMAKNILSTFFYMTYFPLNNLPKYELFFCITF